MKTSILTIFIAFGTIVASSQTPDTLDTIIPLRGNPIKAKVLKFDGKKVYVQLFKRNMFEKYTVFDTLLIDSLLEIKKNFGPVSVSMWRKKNEPEARIKKKTEAPVIKLPQSFALQKIDTLRAARVEQDSINVGSIDEPSGEVTKDSLIDQRPTPLKRVTPEYPRAAQSPGVGGEVKFKVWINRHGGAEKLEVLEATNQIFVAPSKEALMAWEFSPATSKGTPVGVWATVSFKFIFQH